MPVIDLTDDDFSAVRSESDLPILVEFWAEWCATCKQMSAVLDKLATDYGEDLVIAKLNVDDNPSVAGEFQVRGLPTMMLLQNGEVVATRTGAAPKTVLRSWIDTQLAAQ